jgi:branched-chain amino acid transport system ATP-binding protein
MAVLLELRDLDVSYGRVRAVQGVSLHVAAGEIVAVLGANGAGKTSMLRALLGVKQASRGQVFFDGNDITDWSASRRVRGGLVLVPEGRCIVTTLSVHENLLMGAFNRRLTSDVMAEIEEIYHRFPNLAARRNSVASVLSGGEQQMLAIGRALLALPKLMMLDEPSLGLSPRLCNEVFAYITSLSRERGVSMILVEQNTRRALEFANRAYVFELGRVVSEGLPEALLADRTLLDAYLGQSHARTTQQAEQQTAASQIGA